MATIAGHTFIQDVRGGRKCNCGMTWARLAQVAKDDIGQKGLAHTADLRDYEYREIEAERDRIWRQVTDVAATPDYKPLPKPDEELWGERKPDVDRPCDTEPEDDWLAAIVA